MENTGSTITGSGQQTGTDDKTYNLTSVLYHALQGVENCEIYAEDADDETRDFFDQACQQQKQIAQQAKKLLHDCLMEELQGQGGEQGGSSAFSFGQDQQNTSASSAAGSMA